MVLFKLEMMEMILFGVKKVLLVMVLLLLEIVVIILLGVSHIGIAAW